MILTITEAAEEIGVGAGAVRMMVLRGELKPLRWGAKPLRFWLSDVAEARARRLSATEVARLDMLAARLVALDADAV